MTTYKKRKERKKKSRKMGKIRKIVGGLEYPPEIINQIKALQKKFPKIKEEEIKAAFIAALKGLRASTETSGFLDTFYKAFEKDEDQNNKNQRAELKSAIHNSLLEILYFPSASKSFGKEGKVKKTNTYSNFAILNSHPDTSMSSIIKKNIQTSEDFIASLLQGREGDPHIKPIFKEKIRIKDQSEINEIAKRHMGEKQQEITDLFRSFIKKREELAAAAAKTAATGGGSKRWRNKRTRKRKYKGGALTEEELEKKLKEFLQKLEENTDDDIFKLKENSYYEKLQELYDFKSKIGVDMEKGDYTMVMPPSTQLYEKDKAIKELQDIIKEAL
jgi:hypothetical protein